MKVPLNEWNIYNSYFSIYLFILVIRKDFDFIKYYVCIYYLLKFFILNYNIIWEYYFLIHSFNCKSKLHKINLLTPQNNETQITAKTKLFPICQIMWSKPLSCELTLKLSTTRLSITNKKIIKKNQLKLFLQICIQIKKRKLQI